MREAKQPSAPRAAMSGGIIVEFALVAPMVLLLLFAIAQFGLYLENRVLLSNAAISASHLLSAKRGIACPYTRTGCGKKGALDIIRQKLEGQLASAAKLDEALKITLQIRSLYDDADACNEECTGDCEDRICVQPCNDNDSCATALGTHEIPPPPGTLARVELTYVFTPILNAFGLENMTSIRVGTSEPVQ